MRIKSPFFSSMAAVVAVLIGLGTANAQTQPTPAPTSVNAPLYKFLVTLAANPSRATGRIATAVDKATTESPGYKMRAVYHSALEYFVEGAVGSDNINERTEIAQAVISDLLLTFSKNPGYMRAVYAVVKPGLVAVMSEHSHRFGADFSLAFSIIFTVEAGKLAEAALQSCRDVNGAPAASPSSECKVVEGDLMKHFGMTQNVTEDAFVPFNTLYLTRILLHRHSQGGMAAVAAFQDVGADLVKSSRTN